MIYGVSGYVEGGKSWYCVDVIKNHLARGGHIVTNLTLRPDGFQKYYDFNPDFLKTHIHTIDLESNPDPWTWPRGDDRGSGNSRKVMLVIDEAGEWLGIASSRQQERYKSWLRQTSKRGQDIYMIVQHPSILMRQGRVLVQQWVIVTNMRLWKIPVLGIGIPPPWRWRFRIQVFHSDSFGTSQALLLNRYFISSKTRVGELYYTAQYFGSAAGEIGVHTSIYDTDDLSISTFKESSNLQILKFEIIIKGVFLCAILVYLLLF